MCLSAARERYQLRAVGTGGAEEGAIAPPQILADQLTLSKSAGQTLPTILLFAPPDFQIFGRLWP